MSAIRKYKAVTAIPRTAVNKADIGIKITIKQILPEINERYP